MELLQVRRPICSQTTTYCYRTRSCIGLAESCDRMQPNSSTSAQCTSSTNATYSTSRRACMSGQSVQSPPALRLDVRQYLPIANISTSSGSMTCAYTTLSNPISVRSSPFAWQKVTAVNAVLCQLCSSSFNLVTRFNGETS